MKSQSTSNAKVSSLPPMANISFIGCHRRPPQSWTRPPTPMPCDLVMTSNFLYQMLEFLVIIHKLLDCLVIYQIWIPYGGLVLGKIQEIGKHYQVHQLTITGFQELLVLKMIIASKLQQLWIMQQGGRKLLDLYL